VDFEIVVIRRWLGRHQTGEIGEAAGESSADGRVGPGLRHELAGTALPAPGFRVNRASPEEVISMADEAFAVRVLDALHYGRTAVRQHDGVRVL
jgi:hypothetical protein